MKRADLLWHLERHGCEVLREGGSHTVYVNRSKRLSSTIPRHREINEFLTLHLQAMYADDELDSAAACKKHFQVARFGRT